eukprot:TRINITY_DN164_c0_g1_i2.p2 TRINITY_DN164_c0_g1~~TRINITY_DN164_c0_g1_i2.p2  ORF type:complete len:193 (+),score=81.16 TRINITY_DN164_c0_g1_i2:117-695(+)
MFTFVAFLAFIALVSANANGSGQCTVPKELGGITGMKDRARDGTVTVTVSKESANVGDKITVTAKSDTTIIGYLAAAGPPGKPTGKWSLGDDGRVPASCDEAIATGVNVVTHKEKLDKKELSWELTLGDDSPATTEVRVVVLQCGADACASSDQKFAIAKASIAVAGGSPAGSASTLAMAGASVAAAAASLL